MAEIKSEETSEKKSLNFIEQIVENDLKEGKNGGKVQTRFPPEPNGYLHIGHAKAICLDFGIATAHGGVCNLRFDDTNPTKEDVEYVEAIKEDIQWLGYKWGNEYYASDYFQQLWDFAIRLIKEGKAYIDEQTSEQIAAQKGTPTQPGVESPYRNRPIEETLDLFQKMNSGEIEEGAMVLRAKIDMASPNMHFRDPIIYRVVKHPHHRTGTTWKAYPMYDFAHGQSDFFEGVTHSLCTLEFVPHRPLYDLFVDWVKEGKDLDDNRPHQYEFNMHKTKYGRQIFLIGVNQNAAEYSGINSRLVIMSTYVLSAMSAAVAGIVLTSYLGTAKSDIGATLTMPIITAVVLGGTLSTGGKGSVPGTALAAVVIGVLRFGLPLCFKVSQQYLEIPVGLILLVVVVGRSLANNQKVIAMFRRKKN